MDALVGVVLVNYRGIADCCHCVESIRKSTYTNVNIYIVNNDTAEESRKELNERLGEFATIINAGRNDGFGAANNIGFDAAIADGCTYLMALNNDTVIDSGMIGVLVTAATDANVTVPLMLYFDQPSLIWYGGGSFNRFAIPKHSYYRCPLSAADLKKQNVTFATGCCFMMHRAIYEAVGGFDQDYFLYWEDADLSIRWLRAGVTICFCPAAILYHKVSSSTGGEASPRTYYYETRNRFRAIKKLNLGIKAYCWAYLALLRGLVSRNPQYKFAGRAYFDFVRGRYGEMG